MKELPMKGFILPNGKILEPTDTNSLSHETIAFRYIRDNGLFQHYRESVHSAAQDYLVYELNAMKIRSAGQKNLVLLVKNYKYFARYIDEYQNYDRGWDVQLLSG